VPSTGGAAHQGLLPRLLLPRLLPRLLQWLLPRPNRQSRTLAVARTSLPTRLDQLGIWTAKTYFNLLRSLLDEVEKLEVTHSDEEGALACRKGCMESALACIHHQ